MNVRPGTNSVGGVTLIEAIVYMALLSVLITGVVQFACGIQEQDMKLIQEIDSSI